MSPRPAEHPAPRSPAAHDPAAHDPVAHDPVAHDPGDPAGRDPAARDRDSAGRARNARPRDALGRPLPRGAPGDERIPDDLLLPPAEALRLAQDLLDAGRPFHAHEVLEASWKAAPPAERDLWQGLAQIAVGLTHARRGNARGATALLRRGGQRVSGYAGAAPYRIDAAGICQAAGELATRIDREGLATIGAELITMRIAPAAD